MRLEVVEVPVRRQHGERDEFALFVRQRPAPKDIPVEETVHDGDQLLVAIARPVAPLEEFLKLRAAKIAPLPQLRLQRPFRDHLLR
ncbi:hypothetical protein SDC9_125262 [bioreactor metagenome]|uniref:Uncharacterized protein n=1 Tax=bioreactor metagenome TaxID=1076179 RepID=A0A645CMT9_9ZZZZ